MAPPVEKKITKLAPKEAAKSVVEAPVKKEDKNEIDALKKIRLDPVFAHEIDPKERKESMPPETKDL